MKGPEIIAFEDLDAAIAKLDRSRVNPVGPYGCLYTSEDGADHCLVGQLWSDLGLPVPGSGTVKPASIVARDNATSRRYVPGALMALDLLQTVADRLAVEPLGVDDEPRGWGAAIEQWPAIKARALAEVGEPGERVIG